MSEILKQIGAMGIVPIVVIDNAKDAKPLGEALMAGGLPCIEITLRTPAAAEAIKAVSQIPGMLVGAGTVLTVENVDRALECGAKFIVTPGFNPKVVDYCMKRNVPITPGVATPTEIEMVLDHGLTVVKFFPAESIGGAKALKAISAPYGMVKFLPTGGITEVLLPEYLKLPCVMACGGSWMVAREQIAKGEFATITELAKAAVKLAASVRPR